MAMSKDSTNKTISINKQSNDGEAQKRRPIRGSGLRDRSKVPDQYRTQKTENRVETKQSETEPPRQPSQTANPSKKAKHTRRDSITNKKPAFNQRQRQTPTRGGKLRDGYDPERPHQASNAVKKQSASTHQDPRLSKVMADRGLCSRREADVWIENGWVTVNGKLVDQLGSRVPTDVEIIIDKQAHDLQAESVTFLLNKPIGYVSGQPEDGYEPAMALITAENEWTEQTNAPEHLRKTFRKYFLKGLAPAGRLDIDSSGLLVLTQDGRVARKLIGENSSVEKEYLVRVEGDLIADGLKLLNFGLSLDGQPLKRAKVSWQNEDQLRFVLKEGKKRQIRRMCELVGLNVVGLKRIRIGQIPLSKLPVGQWRYLGKHERF